MVFDECVASLCLKTILENDIEDVSEKNIYAALRNLSSLGHKSIYPYALAGLIKEKESFSKTEFHLFNPHFDTTEKLEKYLSTDEIDALTDLDSILKAVTKAAEFKDINLSDQKFESQIEVSFFKKLTVILWLKYFSLGQHIRKNYTMSMEI